MKKGERVYDRLNGQWGTVIKARWPLTVKLDNGQTMLQGQCTYSRKGSMYLEYLAITDPKDATPQG